jgi:hypothetical protein
MEGPNGMKERLGLPELHHLGPLIAIACIALGGLSAAVAELQRDLYQAVKSDPDLKRYPVFHVSEGGAEKCASATTPG